MLAAIRPDDVNLSLFVHVFGAMVLVGALTTAATAAVAGWRDQWAPLRRLSYKTLLYVALPAWFVMRVGAQWVYSEQGWDDVPEGSEPAWLGIGYVTADLGGILLLLALILGGIGLRKSRTGGGGGLLKASGVLATLLVAIYVIAVWAMGGKPD